jgi:alkanesulfonate monooxygenase SsuD/methylene tetrahydromethanopterin reductase-like flavin-dependent oxidoreductase (luciferase family)
MHRLGPAAVLDAADRAAAGGYRSLWTVEGRGFAATALLAAVATRVPGIGLGTGVLPVPLHRPTVAAMAVATVQSLDPSRTVWVGLGVSSPTVAGAWHGAPYPERPLAYLREYVSVLRRALSGERVDHDGPAFTIRGFQLEAALVPVAPPPIVLAGLNQRMFDLAGEIADGVLVNAVPLSAADVIAGRAADAGNTHVLGYVHGSVADPDVGLAAARRTIAGEITADGYARLFRSIATSASV